MNVKPFKSCCRKTAIEAFQQKIFYLVGCELCGTCFSITDDFQLLLQQIIAFYKMNANYPRTFDIVLCNNKIIFMLP